MSKVWMIDDQRSRFNNQKHTGGGGKALNERVPRPEPQMTKTKCCILTIQDSAEDLDLDAAA